MSPTTTLWLTWLNVALIASGLWLAYVHVLSPTARAQPRALGPWSVDAFTFGLCTLAVIGGMVAVQTLAVVLFGVPDASTDPLRFITVNGSIHAGALLAIGLLRVFLGARLGTPASLPWTGHTVTAGFVVFLIALPPVALANYGWTGVLQQLGVEAPRQELIDVLRGSEQPAARLVFALFAVVIAPAAEELIFRGGLFRFLRTRVPRGAALVGTSVLFAGAHFYLGTLVPLTVFGLILALAYERTGRIGVPIVAHACFNLLTVILVLLGAVPP